MFPKRCKRESGLPEIVWIIYALGYTSELLPQSHASLETALLSPPTNNQEKKEKYNRVRTLSCRVCTSSASTFSLSAQDSMSDRVSRISVTSSLMRLTPPLIVVKALSRSFLIWMSRDVRLERPSSSGVWKLKESGDKYWGLIHFSQNITQTENILNNDLVNS